MWAAIALLPITRLRLITHRLIVQLHRMQLHRMQLRRTLRRAVRKAPASPWDADTTATLTAISVKPNV
jgi:hypothetical protein